MKYVLFIIMMNLAQPQEPAKMFHKTFDSFEECYKNGEKFAVDTKEIKVSAFCVSENDILDLEVA